jgi:aryl-alcohol dehydrogenase-like predicted oxidoreductase
MGIGTWGLSGDAYGKVAESDAERVLRRAVEIGFTLIDTADAYGAGRMERLVGKVLKDHKDLVVVTKVGIDRTSDPARKCFEPEYLRSAVERSLKRLGADAIPLLLLHHPSPDALHVGDGIGELAALKKAGKIRHWGVAAGDEDVARTAIDKDAEVVELAYNLIQAIDLHRISGDVMVAGCGILARSVLSYGLLSGTWAKDRSFDEHDHRNDRWTKMELEHRVGQLDALQFLLNGEVRTLRGAAVRYVLANYLVSSAILGPKSVEQLEQLVRETGGGPRYIPDDDLRKLPRALDRVGIHT